MKKLLIALPLLWMLISCAKKAQPEPDAPICKVTSSNDSEGNPLEIFKYNSSGLISEIYDTATKTSQYFTYQNSLLDQVSWNSYMIKYKYNNFKRLDTILRYDDVRLVYKVIFEYDDFGNVLTKTTYITTHGTETYFYDSCRYSNYVQGRPLNMERNRSANGSSPAFYEYEYDSHMNKTKAYLVKNSSDRVLILENVFDVDLIGRPIYTYVDLTSNFPQGITFDLDPGNIGMDTHMRMETKNYNDQGELITHTKVSDVKAVNKHPTSWKWQVTDANNVTQNQNYNFSYSCE